MREIRVGLIRCDTHGAYFAALMDRHDPMLLRSPQPPNQPYLHSWQVGGAYFYHYTQYNNPTRMTAEFVDGFRIVKMWDEDRDVAEMLSGVFLGKPEVCDTFDQASDDVDLVFIADCNGDGADHLALATPGLEKGVATFIDKPLAFTVEDATALVRLAARHHAPLYSMSIPGALPHAIQFRNRLSEVGPLESGMVTGGGTHIAGHIHAIVLALAVFGGGVRRVFSTGPNPLDIIHLDYGGAPNRPTTGVTIKCNVGGVYHCAFHCVASGTQGAVLSPSFNDFVFPLGAAEILRRVQEMVRSGTVHDDFSLMIEGVAIAEAARQAHATGRRAYPRQDPISESMVLTTAPAIAHTQPG